MLPHTCPTSGPSRFHEGQGKIRRLQHLLPEYGLTREPIKRMTTTTRTETTALQPTQTTKTPVYLPMLSRTLKFFYGRVQGNINNSSNASHDFIYERTNRCLAKCTFPWKKRHIRSSKTTRLRLRHAASFNKKPEDNLLAIITQKK